MVKSFSSVDSNHLAGQTALITGGGTGVGAAVGLALAAEKVHLWLIGRRLQPLQQVATRARNLGVRATCRSADLSTREGQREIVDQLEKEGCHVNILIQNAALFISGAIETSDLEDFDRQYRINVLAPFALTQALLPTLKARGDGQVVFINSSSGIRAKALCSQYDATKHALRAVADSLRDEVNGYGIRVLSVYLGRTASEMQAQIHKNSGKPYLPELLLQP